MRGQPASNPGQVGPDTPAFASKSVALTAARLAECVSARLESAFVFDPLQGRQQIFQFPIPDELLLRLHGTYPVANQFDSSLVHHRGNQRRHLTATATCHPLVKNRAFRIAGRD
jgi:hypothetical protein